VTGGTDGAPATPPVLGALDAEVLRLAVRGLTAGALANAAHELGLSLTGYHKRLNALLDDPAALAAEPTTVNRLRRLRAAGAARRMSYRGR
jgi:hypothetical protein